MAVSEKNSENKDLAMPEPVGYGDKFERVLDDDEKVIKVFKPNKVKFFVSQIISFLCATLVFAVVGIIACLFPEEGNEPSTLGAVLVGVGYLAVMGVYYLLARVYYKNVFYAYTNKRIIICSGIFGVDYKSLDMAMIGAVNVYVSLFDKIVRKNTGSVAFGSMASPMYGENASRYRFAHIVMPYETCKEIKSQVDAFKKQNSSN